MAHCLLHLIDQDQAQLACLQSVKGGINGEKFSIHFLYLVCAGCAAQALT